MGLCDCYLYGAPFDDEELIGAKVIRYSTGTMILLAPIGHYLKWSWFI